MFIIAQVMRPSGYMKRLDCGSTELFLIKHESLIIFINLFPLFKLVSLEGVKELLSASLMLFLVVPALFALMLSVAGFATLLFLGFPITYVYHKYLQLITTAVVFAFLLSVLLYAHSFYVAAECLAVGGNSGE